MSLSPLEQHVFAHYVDTGADKLEMVGRFWPYGELVLIIEDKVQLGVGKYGFKAKMAAPAVSRALLDLLIERGAFSSAKGEFGGTMHQYQGPKYQDCIKQLKESDPIIQKARAGGANFWEEAFAALTK